MMGVLGVEQAAQGLFDARIAVAAVAIGTAPPPWPEEAAAVANAVPKRRAEFAAGRAAARAALARLGVAPVAVPVGAHRAPVWPKGFVGSVTHSAGIALAAVARRGDADSVGLDIETDLDLPADLAGAICTGSELSGQENPARAARVIFCAKEALFKAQFPLTAVWLGFSDVAVTLAPDGTFSALFHRKAGRFAVGQRVSGRHASAGGVILAAVTVAPGAGGGG